MTTPNAQQDRPLNLTPPRRAVLSALAQAPHGVYGPATRTWQGRVGVSYATVTRAATGPLIAAGLVQVSERPLSRGKVQDLLTLTAAGWAALDLPTPQPLSAHGMPIGRLSALLAGYGAALIERYRYTYTPEQGGRGEGTISCDVLDPCGEPVGTVTFSVDAAGERTGLVDFRLPSGDGAYIHDARHAFGQMLQAATGQTWQIS